MAAVDALKTRGEARHVTRGGEQILAINRGHPRIYIGFPRGLGLPAGRVLPSDDLDRDVFKRAERRIRVSPAFVTTTLSPSGSAVYKRSCRASELRNESLAVRFCSNFAGKQQVKETRNTGQFDFPTRSLEVTSSGTCTWVT